MLFDRLGVDIPITREWLTGSYSKISSSPSYSSPEAGAFLPPPEQMSSLYPAQKTVASFLPALVDLVVFPPNPTSSSLPASPTTTPVSKLNQSYQVSMQPGYPETLYLDHSRLLLLTSDASDITANAMYLALYRQLIFSSSAKSGKRTTPLSDEQLIHLKREIGAVGTSRPGLCFCRDYSVEPKEGESVQVTQWRNDVHSTALHIAHAIELEGKEGDISFEENAARFQPPKSDLLDSVTNWFANNMRPDSSVSTVFRKKVAMAILKQLVPRFFALWNAGSQQRPGMSHSQSFFSMEGLPEFDVKVDADLPKPKTGLEPLGDEIKVLAERLAKLAVLHLRVFLPFYDQSGAISV
jgi:hypothetical protein